MKYNALFLRGLAYIVLLVSCNQTSQGIQGDFRSERFNAYLNNSESAELSLEERSKQLYNAYEFNSRAPLDSLKVSRYAQIARAAIKTSDSTMFYLANAKAEVLSQEINNLYLSADVAWNFAEYYLTQNLYDSAYIHYQKGYVLFRQISHPYYSGKMLYNMGYIKSLITDYTGAEIMLFQALNIFQEMKKKQQIFQTYNLLGSIYADLQEYDRALEYYQKALEFLSENKDYNITKEDILNNLGLVYQKIGNQKEAITTFNLALEKEILAGERPELYARLLDNRAYSFMLDKQNGKVLNGFETALKIRDSLKNVPSIIMSHLHLATYFLQNREFAPAFEKAEAAYSLSSGIELNRDKLSSLQLLAKIDTVHAAKYLTEYINLNASLQAQKEKTRDKFARIHFETDQYIKANEKLSKEKILLAVTVITISILLIFLFIIMNQRNRNKQLKFTAEQQKSDEEIYSLRINQMKQSEKARQEERERIAEDLHDSILGQLYGIRLNWEFQDLVDEDGVTLTKQQQLENLLRVEKEIRNLSHNLVENSSYDGAQLTENLKLLLKEKAELGNFKYQFKNGETIDWEAVDEFTKVNLYRIIEESLHNIVKHAHASKVKLAITENEGIVTILISDNGKGFTENGNKRGIGIKNIKSRAKKIGAVLTITSSPEGTTILIILKKLNHGR